MALILSFDHRSNMPHHLAINIEKNFRREKVRRVFFVKGRDEFPGRGINISGGTINLLHEDTIFFSHLDGLWDEFPCLFSNDISIMVSPETHLFLLRRKP